MRLVIATLLPGQVEAVRQALAEVHVTRLSIADAHGYAGEEGGGLAQLAVIEVAVNDDFLERTVATIVGVMNLTERTDAPGAAGPDDPGMCAGPALFHGTGLYVLPIEETVQIYRAVRGQEAI